MKVDLMCMRPDLGGIAALAKQAEDLGYAALLAAETGHEPFMPLALAAQHTSRLQLGTCVAVALSRSPVHLAHAGHDLQRFSEGRFILGIGSQGRGHIEKRFSATFSQPTERMKDAIGAIRAIWRSWNEGEPLKYEGPSGAEMTAVGGEAADGLMLHALTSVATMAEITWPALERGLKASGRTRADLELYAPVFVITGDSDEELQTAERAVRLQMAFYASTPAYRKVLAFHGRPDLPPNSTAWRKRAGGRRWAG